MVTITYVHDHDCQWRGEEVVRRPEIVDGAFVRQQLMCSETFQALKVIERESV